MALVIARASDTVGSLARRFSVSEQELRDCNGLSDPQRLTEGLALWVPLGENEGGPERLIQLCAFPTLRPDEARPWLESGSTLALFAGRLGPGGALLPCADRALFDEARRAHCAPLLCLSNLDERGTFSAELAHALLAKTDAWDALLAQLERLLAEWGCGGLLLHMQLLHPFDREAFCAFVHHLAAKLHGSGRALLVALAPRESEQDPDPACAFQDYARLGRDADWVAVLSYDWGHACSAPQPISPLDRVRSAMRCAAREVPLRKLLLGLSNYAYDWTLPHRSAGPARLMTTAAAMNLAVSRGVPVIYDEHAAASRFDYTDADHRRHRVWFEDLRSVRARLSLVEELGLGGVSLWTANFPNPMLLAALRERFTPLRLL